MVMLPVLFKCMCCCMFGHLSLDLEDGFDKGVGRGVDRNFFYHEGILMSVLVLMYIIKFTMQRFFLLKAHEILYCEDLIRRLEFNLNLLLMF